MVQHYARPLGQLIEALGMLPGIGPKSAQRIAMHLIAQPREQVGQLARAIYEAKEQIRYCDVCCNLSEKERCEICRDPKRRQGQICVVQTPADVIAMEKTREFSGSYHVLHGAISPMDSVGPGELKIKELLERVGDENVDEVIVATNPNVEGEATALYLAKVLKPLDLRVTRIARGIPEGGDLDYIDTVTLGRALEGRREISL